MRRIFLFLLCLPIGFSLLVGCTKYGLIDDEKKEGTTVDLLERNQATAALHVVTIFKLGQKTQGYRWRLDGQEVSMEPAYAFTPSRQGVFTLTLETAAGNYSCRIYAVRPVSDGASKWIDQVLEYRPAPGQFINTAAWGTPQRAQSIVGPQADTGERGGVSLGAFGGYVVFQFDHSVLNRAGCDFVIHGNALENASEPGMVMVAFDQNGNGRPDAGEWYELAGEDHALPSAKKNYTLTYFRPDDLSQACDVYWEDSDGTTGFLDAARLSPFYRQSFWPLFLAGDPDRLTFTGTCLPDLTVDRSSGGVEYWDSSPAGEGYADNYSPDYLDIVNLDPDTKRANKFDISRAVDPNGEFVSLPAIDFIKVYTGVRQSAGWLGEGSTEVCGAISLTAPK